MKPMWFLLALLAFLAFRVEGLSLDVGSCEFFGTNGDFMVQNGDVTDVTMKKVGVYNIIQHDLM